MKFNENGLLPLGDYPLTLSALKNSILVQGDGNDPDWDREWRALLVDNASVLIHQLWKIGIHEIFLDGSFVEQKSHPNDIDGYFVCDLFEHATGRLERDLNKIDPYKVWTWDSKSRYPYQGHAKHQLPMWHRYRVELYPHFGQTSGIKDEFGNELKFPSAFRQARYTYLPKGIVKIIKGE